MWTRAASESFNRTLVERWNKTHDAKIKLTVIPDDQYVTKVSTSGASGDLPDLLSVDLIYMPQFNQAQIMADITEDVDGLGYKDSLSPAHMELAEWEGATYGVPYGLETSTLFYNKELYERAGLDPEKPPTNWREIEEHAKKIDALGDVNGFYFPGNCAGCNAFTLLPLVTAQGSSVVTESGEANMDSPEMKRALEFYKGFVEQDLVPKSAKGDAGDNWVSTFASGKVGIMPGGAFFVAALKDSAPDLEFGNTFLVGPDGEKSSFGGGDILGISATSEKQDEAFGYIEWVLSEETQVEILAKDGFMVGRTDLADNEYADELIEVQNKALEVAQTPKTFGYNEIFNDANGPWINMVNSAVFGGDVGAATSGAQQRTQQILDDQNR